MFQTLKRTVVFVSQPMLDAYQEQFEAAFGAEKKCQVFTLWIVEQYVTFRALDNNLVWSGSVCVSPNIRILCRQVS